MNQAERDYEFIKTYLIARIESEFDREYRPHLVSAIRSAGVEALGAIVFPKPQDVEYTRSIDEIARFAARKAMGFEAPEPQVSPVPAPTLLAGIQAHADEYARQVAAREKSGERSAPTADVREMVKGEVAAWHRDMHRGVWQEGTHYEKGQMVTRSGCTWSCQRDNPTTKPGESSDWVMVVKAGRDGKR